VATTYPPTPGIAGEPEDPLGWIPPDDLTAREVCEIEIPEGQEVWGPVATRAGRVVLGGKSGEGKTTLAMGIVKAVADGTDLLGWTGCGGTVLIFDLEQGLRTVQRQLTRNGLDQSERVRYYRIPDGLDLANDETQAAWMLSRIIEHQPVMVVLDPLYKAHQGDSNDERAMVDMMRLLDRWRDEYGFCLVIPMHLRKTDPRASDPSMDDIFGSGGLTRGAEVVLGLKKNAPGKSTLYFWKDRDGDLHEESKWRLLFTHEDGFERDPEDKGPPPTELVTRAFLHAGNMVMTHKEVVQATGMSADKARDTIKLMVSEGSLEEMAQRGAHGTKRYRLRHVPDDDVRRYEQIAQGEWS
jgi:hypothetical protein